MFAIISLPDFAHWNLSLTLFTTLLKIFVVELVQSVKYLSHFGFVRKFEVIYKFLYNINSLSLLCRNYVGSNRLKDFSNYT